MRFRADRFGPSRVVTSRYAPKHVTGMLRAPSPRTSTFGAIGAIAVVSLAGLLTVGRDTPVSADRAGFPARALNAGLASTGPQAPGSPGFTTSPVSVPTHISQTDPAGNASAGTQLPYDDTPASALAASGIPSTALDAYRGAAATEQARDPDCQLTWPLLAAIGRVESNHGRYGGAVLHSDGLSTPAIVGPALNGHGTELVRDTDLGRLDGDKVYDHALGPMQFIPETWARWGVDADSDGRRNPFDIFDAAAAAADYLCAGGRDLATSRGQEAAVLSYNHSAQYLTEVLAVEAVYAGQAGSGVPVVPTTPDPTGSGGTGGLGAPVTDWPSALAAGDGNTPVATSTTAAEHADTVQTVHSSHRRTTRVHHDHVGRSRLDGVPHPLPSRNHTASSSLSPSPTRSSSSPTKTASPSPSCTSASPAPSSSHSSSGSMSTSASSSSSSTAAAGSSTSGSPAQCAMPAALNASPASSSASSERIVRVGPGDGK